MQDIGKFFSTFVGDGSIELLSFVCVDEPSAMLFALCVGARY